MFDILRNNESARFLAKIKIDFEMKTRRALFSLPDFEVPKKKGEAIVDWDVIEANKDHLLSPTEVWGIVEIVCELDENGKDYIFKLIDFSPFCPYTIDLTIILVQESFSALMNGQCSAQALLITTLLGMSAQSKDDNA